MSGLFALLDDVAALVRLSAASVDDVAAAAGRASAKAAGVVVDDAAVTPRYVQGLDPKRELSVIWRIAKGSIRNKLLIILPAALLLSSFRRGCSRRSSCSAACYLAFEGAEKVWEKISGHDEPGESAGGRRAGPCGAREERRLLRRADRLHPLRRDHGDRAERGRGEGSSRGRSSWRSSPS